MSKWLDGSAFLAVILGAAIVGAAAAALVPGIIVPPIPQREALAATYPSLDEHEIQLLEIDLIRQRDEDLAQARVAAIQWIGAAVIAGGAWLTFRRSRAVEDQVRVAEKGQLTERFTAAVGQIGNQDSLDVRLGGIYALEGIVREAHRLGPDRAGLDARVVLEVLAAYVRHHAPLSGCGTDDAEGPPTDVQAALTVLGRTAAAAPDHIVDLTRSCLIGADMRTASLASARLTGSKLATALLDGAVLDGADLTDCTLTAASLRSISLRAAQMVGCRLVGADCTDANFEDADISDGDLTGSTFRGANLTRVRLWGASFDPNALRDATTTGLEAEPPAVQIGD